MKLYITNFYEDIEGTAMIAQQNVVKIATELGFTEMPIRGLQVRDYTYNEVKKRIYGVTAGIREGDIVVFQSPTWQHDSLYYDKLLMSTLRFQIDIKIAIFIHDVMPFMLGKSEEDYRRTIEIYNMADLLIVPSKAMLIFLQEKGLSVEKILIQELWDLPFDGELEVPKFQRQIYFSGSPERFQFLTSWNYDIPLKLFQKSCPLNGQNICFEDWKNTTELLIEYTRGGFGLIWEQTRNSNYYKCNQPYKLAAYLAAGIPIIVEKGLGPETLVQEYDLGYVVQSLDEAVHIVQNITEEKYYQIVNNIRNISFMVRNGFFTKKLLLDVIENLLLENKLNKTYEKKYYFLKENGYKPEALICTNSDRIEHCEELVKSLPEMHFHIAAFTAMSPKLMSMSTYNNVSLYPGVNMEGLNELFVICDYYFDINYWKEIALAVYRAFISNQLIFAFDETVHYRKYVSGEQIYSINDFEKMVLDIKATIEKPELLKQWLDRQRKKGMENA